MKLLRAIVAAQDLPAMRQFYELLLDQPLRAAQAGTVEVFVAGLGEVTLILCPAAAAGPGTGRHQFDFQVEGIDAIAERLTARGYAARASTAPCGTRRLATQDPDGTTIQLVQPAPSQR